MNQLGSGAKTHISKTFLDSNYLPLRRSPPTPTPPGRLPSRPYFLNRLDKICAEWRDGAAAAVAAMRSGAAAQWRNGLSIINHKAKTALDIPLNGKNIFI